ncbi:MAG: PaaI family thioesterase [Neomegalonema sp.]|nr:PaaI family thioesterase [Neomegalonema sp.]
MSQFQPRNPDFETRLRASFSRQRAMQSIGISLVELSPGRVVLEMPFNPDFTQQHGYLHAGTVTTGLDSACGYAAFSLMAADAEVLSVEFKTNLLAPAKAPHFRFVAEVVKAGRTISVAEARGYGVDGAQEKLIASMTCTLMAVPA